LLAPLAPYITEELWSRLQGNRGSTTPISSRVLDKVGTKSGQKVTSGVTSSIHNQKWPKFRKQLAKKANITLVIQVNGKVRDKIEVPADVTEAKAKKLAMERENIKKWLEGKEIKKVIFVKGKLINIVV